MTTSEKVHHPNTPKRLAAEFKKADYRYHVLANRLGVNVKWVYRLIVDGTEPTDRTAKGQAARVKLFLPRKKRGPRKERPPLTRMQIAIRTMMTETRGLGIIRNYLKGNQS